MSFLKSEIIVRDDHCYPEGALVVDGVDAAGNLLAHPLGGGLQLIIPTHEHSRFSKVSEDEKTPVFHPAHFELEGVDGKFRGWSDGRVWNGWAMPRIEFSESQRLITALGNGWYDPAADKFITAMDPDEPENWPAEMIDLPDGGNVKVYPIGAGSWIWEQCEKEDAV